MNSIELFAGAGGLAMGMANAGFHHCGLVEWNPHACQTIRENPQRYSDAHGKWKLYEGDARGLDYASFGDDIAVVSGGPPCQPFSLGGKHGGSLDTRDMFPEAVRSIREIRPKAFIFENVKGLLRQNFASYLEYTILQLTYPFVTRCAEETWESHLARLERHHTSVPIPGELRYKVLFRLLNAANYGVPQKRERVFIVGFREDLNVEWSFPEPTHSEDALLHSMWISGDYWERHKVPRSKRPTQSTKMAARVSRLSALRLGDELLPWVTVRDTIRDLPDPVKSPNNKVLNHVYIPGARSYPGHTGSPLDEPAKTLKAGDHGVPGGENMIAMPDGSVRYFTIREAARIQTFPDDYVFHGSWGEIMRQLGNAVPVKLGEVVAKHVAAHLRAVGA
ncbi:DNA cytosine methyltransferase [Pseudoduganella chitinolytica]|uniref:DNA (cytosine-5-)-methyltransferase n=1 Tax=Pseudoduganella chitinolytica TaxID=34070 RepID=A0ABY8B8L1_9BURK|nr:DNA cytosine methyltransferase [Pseudoduganella chitinolytica]WEF30699.1 DNA cytosine methyltransferase [Pseudoduganella chitinolytica]